MHKLSKVYKKYFLARLWNGNPMGKLLLIDAGYFCAGVEVGVMAAPVIKYMVDWPEEKIRAYAARKRWKVKDATEDQWIQLDDDLEGTPEHFLDGLIS